MATTPERSVLTDCSERQRLGRRLDLDEAGCHSLLYPVAPGGRR